MVNVADYSQEQLHKILKTRRILCVGAGRNLDRFLDEFRGVSVAHLFDNYATGVRKIVNDTISIQTVDSIRQCALDRNNDLIVITTVRCADLVEQLDDIIECDGIECIAPYVDSLVSLRDANNSVNQREAGSKFQLFFDDGNYSQSINAGGKAPKDIAHIAETMGYQIKRVNSYWLPVDDDDWQSRDRRASWARIEDAILDDSILLLQNPNWNAEEFNFRKERILELKDKKGIKIVSVVHDVEELRKIDYTDYMKCEAEFMLNTSDVLIVHNRRMVEFYLEKGLDENKLVNLGIFDYICNGEIPSRGYSREVIIAGNLSLDKNPHIAELRRLNGLTFRLYGDGYIESAENCNIHYEGTVSSDELPNMLPDGFGLVWGGDSLDGCTGNAGDYLRYNDPHKLSLYLAAGLPVIIWSQAAMAEFVIKNEVGVVVSSLYQLKDILEQISDEEYGRLASNAKRVGLKLRAGEYTKAALSEAESRIRKLGEK